LFRVCHVREQRREEYDGRGHTWMTDVVFHYGRHR
jgi:hypothetical protein